MHQRSPVLNWILFVCLQGWVISWPAVSGLAAPAESVDRFKRGFEAYAAGGFEQAATSFSEIAAKSPSSGTLHNLGNAEWKCGRPGLAVLAWERAQWIDPFNADTAANLRFARKVAQLDSPELAWHENCSTWLPENTWIWIACASFWLAVAMLMLPGILRWRRTDWCQGIATLSFVVFLLTLPALAGIHQRKKIGIVLNKETELRLTPTANAQVLARMPAGDSGRLEQQRGAYAYIRTSTASGWVDLKQFRLVASIQEPIQAR